MQHQGSHREHTQGAHEVNTGSIESTNEEHGEHREAGCSVSTASHKGIGSTVSKNSASTFEQGCGSF